MLCNNNSIAHNHHTNNNNPYLPLQHLNWNTQVIIDLIVRELFNIPFLTEEEKQEQEQQQEQEQAFDADELRIYYMKFAAAITQRHPEGLYVNM